MRHHLSSCRFAFSDLQSFCCFWAIQHKDNEITFTATQASKYHKQQMRQEVMISKCSHIYVFIIIRDTYMRILAWKFDLKYKIPMIESPLIKLYCEMFSSTVQGPQNCVLHQGTSTPKQIVCSGTDNDNEWNIGMSISDMRVSYALLLLVPCKLICCCCSAPPPSLHMLYRCANEACWSISEVDWLAPSLSWCCGIDRPPIGMISGPSKCACGIGSDFNSTGLADPARSSSWDWGEPCWSPDPSMGEVVVVFSRIAFLVSWGKTLPGSLSRANRPRTRGRVSASDFLHWYLTVLLKLRICRLALYLKIFCSLSSGVSWPICYEEKQTCNCTEKYHDSMSRQGWEY